MKEFLLKYIFTFEAFLTVFFIILLFDVVADSTDKFGGTDIGGNMTDIAHTIIFSTLLICLTYVKVNKSKE